MVEPADGRGDARRRHEWNDDVHAVRNERRRVSGGVDGNDDRDDAAGDDTGREVVRARIGTASSGAAAVLRRRLSAVWVILGIPAYFAWRGLNMPIADGADWVARLAGGSLIAAGVWQLTPLKKMCLKNCRSPMSFFLQHGGRLERPLGASRMGATHGLFCVGCCWAMFVVLVAVGTMNIGWMLILTALIVTEKTFRHGERVATFAAVAFLILGTVLLASPGAITVIT